MNTVNNQKGTWKYVAGLLAASLLWGLSYPATKVVTGYPVFFILSVRFLVATAAMALLFHRSFRLINRQTILWAALCSLFITFMYIFSTLGIKYTTSARASFFTCLTFVFVPLLNFIIYRTRPSRIIIISVLICLAGVLLLSYSPAEGHRGFNRGDLLCLLASVMGSLHILYLERIAKKRAVNNALFTTLLMGFVGLWTTIIACTTGVMTTPAAPRAWLIIVFLGLFCSAAAYLLQTICQEYVPANQTGVIFAMEPASGCILSVLLLGESMGRAGIAGAVIIMASLLYMEIAGSRAAARSTPPKE
ncbi:MAG: DMT family transporter [Eubacteriales bacterium]|nr:DMT family transporter [Eubacteriales bacterium]